MTAGRFGIVGFALVLALGGCKKSEEDRSSETKTTSATTEQAKPQPLSNDDIKFIDKAAQGGMLEVKLGSEAARRATSIDVKRFADHMVADHGTANAELADLAGKKGYVAPSQIDDTHNKKIADVLKLEGKKLDEKYIKDMVDDHEKDVDLFEKASTELKDPDLRAWASNKLPTLRMHLNMAKDAKAKVVK